jgi:D-serine deaminase-like pyridoxal phosphate-dependent protein
MLARTITDHPGLDLAGIFTHEGHLYRGKDGVDRAAAADVADAMRRLAVALREQGTPVVEISVGSTPGAPLMAPEPGLTELRPGVYVFNDRSQARRGSTTDQCALTVLATVISVRPDGTVIIDAGSKSLASDCPFADKSYGELPGHPELVFAGISEEHGHLRCDGAISVRVGDRVQIIPNHACTCVNMHDSMTAIRGEQVEAEWRIAARGRLR